MSTDTVATETGADTSVIFVPPAGTKSATIEAIVPGESRRASGAVSMVENTVDPSTGMVTIRATMPNTDEILWPGTLVNVELTLRNENTVLGGKPIEKIQTVPGLVDAIAYLDARRAIV